MRFVATRGVDEDYHKKARAACVSQSRRNCHLRECESVCSALTDRPAICRCNWPGYHNDGCSPGMLARGSGRFETRVSSGARVGYGSRANRLKDLQQAPDKAFFVLLIFKGPAGPGNGRGSQPRCE